MEIIFAMSGIRNRRSMSFSLQMCLVSVCLVLTLLNVDYVHGHVSLSFPQARKFDLDFLSNIWTKAPCGMPKGSYRTKLKAGSAFNATWNLGYAHPGGYRFELLGTDGKKMFDLTPLTPNYGPYIVGSEDAQSQFIQLPSNLSSCVGCTIRFLRQTALHSDGFLFWTCADVDIINPIDYVEQCSGKGYLSGEKCICRERYSGSKCQYEDECDSSRHCNYNGKCVILGTNGPRKQCFCSPGFFGEKCSKSGIVYRPENLDLNHYEELFLNPNSRMKLYYKLIQRSTAEQHEVEFVLVTNGTSYSALGWKPTDISENCRSWPFSKRGKSVWEPTAEFHTMDCSDIVIGSVVQTNGGYFSRVRDYYARGRHTPKLDTVWGGTDDLTSAGGWERGGQTTIVFRRRLIKSPGEGADHTFGGEMTFLYARGQEPGEMISFGQGYPPLKVPEFYTRDEIKYHGTGPERGFITVEFPHAKELGRSVEAEVQSTEVESRRLNTNNQAHLNDLQASWRNFLIALNLSRLYFNS